MKPVPVARCGRSLRIRQLAGLHHAFHFLAIPLDHIVEQRPRLTRRIVGKRTPMLLHHQRHRRIGRLATIRRRRRHRRCCCLAGFCAPCGCRPLPKGRQLPAVLLLGRMHAKGERQSGQEPAKQHRKGVLLLGGHPVVSYVRVDIVQGQRSRPPGSRLRFEHIGLAEGDELPRCVARRSSALRSGRQPLVLVGCHQLPGARDRPPEREACAQRSHLPGSGDGRRQRSGVLCGLAHGRPDESRLHGGRVRMIDERGDLVPAGPSLGAGALADHRRCC